MATEKEIACHKATLLDAINKQDWEHADTEMAWLSQNHPELQPDDFYPDLLSALDQVMGDDCEIPIALTIRGFTKSNLDDYIGAIADFDKAIELDHYNSNAYGHRGTAKGFLGNHQEALADFDISINMNPYNAGVYSNRGSAKDYLGDYQGGLDDYDRAISIQPENPLHYHLKGLALLEIGEEQKADEFFRIFIEKKNKSDNEKSDDNTNKSKRGKKSYLNQLNKKLDDIPDKLSFLKSGRDRIKGRSHHENVLYLHALLDHAMRNTLCYIAVVNLKCNFEITKKYLDSFRYRIENFENKIESTLIDINKYPKRKSQLIQNLNFSILTRHSLAHGKKIGKSSDGTENAKGRWEAISDVTEIQCCKACIYYIDFFIEYLKFFDDSIQNKKVVNKFNPFDNNFQGLIGKRWLDKQQTELILRGIGIIKSNNCPNNKISKQSTQP